jgi:pyridoxal phosphate enzyme (YggS family)
MSIEDNLAGVRHRIEAACRRRGRPVEDVRLVGITKGFPPEDIMKASAAGLTDVGENRLQEAAAKMAALAGTATFLRWHMVGHIQRNKAEAACRGFAMLHGVDSVRLAAALSARAQERLEVLLEVNVAREPSKFGFEYEEVATALREIAALPNINVQGLMTVAPLAENAESVRPLFRDLRKLRDRLGLRELSMGMTDDFEVAIEEGATLVRIGRAIFGTRER